MTTYIVEIVYIILFIKRITLQKKDNLSRELVWVIQ